MRAGEGAGGGSASDEARVVPGGQADGGGGGGGAERGGEKEVENDVTFVRLFSKNEDVDRLNETELRRLEGKPMEER